MPLFMLVSGYLFFFSFAKRNLTELIVHRTQSLLQPIILCSFFNYLITKLPNNIMSGNYTAIFNGGWLDDLYSLWFLWSVLAASLATTVICKKAKNLLLQIVLFIITIPIIALFPNMVANIFMYPYFILGFYFAKYKDKIPVALYRIKYVCLLLFPLLFFFFDKKHYIYTTGLFPNANYSLSQMLIIDAYRWLTGLVGSIFTITILNIIYQQITVRFKKPLLSIWISKIGQKSLQIYVLSVPLLSRFLVFLSPKAFALLKLNNVFTENSLIYNFVFTLLLAILYSFALFFVVKLLEKIKIAKVLFGK